MAVITEITDAEKAYVRARLMANRLRTIAVAKAAQFASATNRDVVLYLTQDLTAHRDDILAQAAVPGVGKYARDHIDDQTYDVQAEYTAMVAALNAVITWITTNFPEQNGFPLFKTLAADGTIGDGQFTAAQLTPLRTELNALIATIGV